MTNVLTEVAVQVINVEDACQGSPLACAPLILETSSSIDNTSPSCRLRRHFLDALQAARPPVVFLCSSEAIAEDIAGFATASNIPFFSSRYDEHLLESRTIGFLREKIQHRICVHGSLVSLKGLGVLIKGDSGAGKTRCAMALVGRGYRWVADDCVDIEKDSSRRILRGRCHGAVNNLLEVKPLGLKKATDLFIPDSIMHESTVDIIVLLCESSSAHTNGIMDVGSIMGVNLPVLKIAASPDAAAVIADNIDLWANARSSILNRPLYERA